MLDSDLDALTNPIVALYREYEDSVINDIARRIGNMSYSSAGWQTQRLTESGMVYKNALKEISKLTGKTEKELRQIFKEAGVKGLQFDDAIYKAAGLDPLPLNLSPAMANVLAAGLAKTKGVMDNLTLTTAMSGQQSFVHAADLAYMQISTGAMSYDQAIQAAVKQVTDGGLKVVNYASGHVDNLDVAMRRTVLTGVTQTAAELTMTRADQMGQDLVQVSAHGGARPSHAAWQGKVYSRSGRKGYDDFVSSTGYGTGAGLAGWNCRHSFYPFFEGISENAYSKSEVTRLNNETVNLNGKTVSVYDATQYQRTIERKIRYWKREAGGMDAAKQPEKVAAANAKVKQWQLKMRTFINDMDAQLKKAGKEYKWQRQPAREKVYTPKGGTVAPKVAEIKKENAIIDKMNKIETLKKYIDNPDDFVDFLMTKIPDDFEGSVGLRGMYSDEKLGKLKVSGIWEDGTRLSENLSGTSVVGLSTDYSEEDRKDLILAIKKYASEVFKYGNDKYGLVIGDAYAKYGNDSWANEIVIKNAKVIFIWE